MHIPFIPTVLAVLLSSTTVPALAIALGEPSALRSAADPSSNLAESRTSVDAPVQQVPAYSMIELPALLDFGSVETGATGYKVITVSNSGNNAAPLVFKGLPAGVHAKAAISELAAGQSCDVLLSWTPTSTATDLQATLMIPGTFAASMAIFGTAA